MTYNPNSINNMETEAVISHKALFNLLEDIAETRDELAKAKEYLSNIIKSMIDMLVVINPDGTIMMVNDATCGLLGCRDEELVGNGASLIFGEGGDGAGEPVIKKLIREGSLKDYDMIYRTKVGEKIPVNLSAAVMKNKQNEVVGIVCIAKDMRQLIYLKEQEKELAAASAAAQIEKRRAKELEAAYEKLRETQNILIQAEKMHAVGQLASGVAHEVRNPLAIIMLGINYLEKKIVNPRKKSRTGVVDTLKIIKNSIKRADKIIGLLFDFSRVTELGLKPEDVNSIIRTSLTLIKNRFKFENINVIKDTKKDLPKVLVDKNKIEQVFVNALLNAVQAMPNGGKIIIRSYNKRLTKMRNGVGNRKDDYFRLGEEVVIVEIEDTGVGIAEENLKRIFDPFFTTKGPQRGVGLGLSVSRNIIDLHKGLIYAESHVGKGTKMVIILRIANRAS